MVYSTYTYADATSYDRPYADIEIKVRIIKVEAVKTLLYGRMSRIPLKDRYKQLRRTHHPPRATPPLHRLAQNTTVRTRSSFPTRETLARTDCESIGSCLTSLFVVVALLCLRKRRILFPGFFFEKPAWRREGTAAEARNNNNNFW